MKDMLIYVFGIIIFSLMGFYYHNYFLYLIVGYIIVLLIKYHYKYFIITLMITIIFLIRFTIELKIPNIYLKEFTIIKVNQYNYYAKNNQGIIMLKTPIKLDKGDKVKISNKLKEISVLENFNLFNYKTYLKSKKINWEVFDKNIKIIKKKTHIKVKSEKTNKVNDYFRYLFFMENENIDEKVKDSLIELSIIHLVVISGLHFNMFYKFLNKILFWAKDTIIRKVLLYSILFLYLVVLSFSYPATRAFLSLLMKNTFINNKLNSLNQLALVGLFMIFISPLALLSYSFLLTFFTSFIILVIPKKLKKNKILLSFSIFLATIPFISALNFEISIFAFIYALIFSPIILILYVVVIIANYFPCFIDSAQVIINLFETLVINLNKYNYKLLIGSIPIILSFLYYCLYFYCLSKSRKHKFCLVIPFLVIIVYSYLPQVSGYITYLDVGQGDCIIIKPPLSNEVMMIDVAQSFKQKNVENIIIPFLKSTKVRKVKKLVITHDDADHAGGKKDLQKLFNVEQVIQNKHSQISFNSYKFVDILAKSKFKDKNRNSITLYTRINGLNYLFTGDIDVQAEMEFKRYVTKLPVDILKVAHHGSKTSTSTDFLALTNPKIAIIQVKKNNHYNHPHPIVMQRLIERKINIYTTANNGSVMVNFFYFFNWISSYNR